MAAKYPEVMAIHDGVSRRPFGIRKDYCVLHPDFERLAMRIVEQMARRYGRDKRVLGFQTDNEFGGSRCRCGLCLAHFRRFLRRRYRTIERLNREYGTWFWGAVYNRFDEIGWPPTDYPNPSFGLDLRRFASQVDVEHQRKQIEILRKFAPAKTVTHNLMGLFSGLDYYALCRDLDYVSWDSYPGTDTADRFSVEALAHAVMWSMKEANFLIMEKQSGPGGWTSYAPQPAPGEMSMLAWQSVARGADGISYFRWRTSISGQEQYWHGILNHDNVRRRRYYEVVGTGRKVVALSKDILGTEPAARVGIYNDYEQIWATDHQTQNADNPIRFGVVMQEFASALAPMGVDFGAFGTGPIPRRFRLALCPPLYLADPRLVSALAAYVRRGGHLVLTARSGVKTVNNKNLMRPLPGPFSALAGVEVDEYAVVPKDADWSVELPEGTIRAQRIREWLLPKRGTEVVGVHRGTYMDGRPAITRRAVGRGAVWYVGTLPAPADWQTLLRRILAGAGIGFRTDLPRGVEAARRAGGGRRLTFYLNHTGEAQTVSLPGRARDLLRGRAASGQLRLPPFGVAVLKESGRGT
jgi:beta-galactosidase